MAEVLLGVNSNIIRWAREYYNMKPEEAATAITVTMKFRQTPILRKSSATT